MISAMYKKQNRNKWEQDVAARQRNTVFPDTAANAAGFWRNLIEGAATVTIAGGRVGCDVFNNRRSVLEYIC
jgi:hypothetical protein